jgi:hypothetical protein
MLLYLSLGNRFFFPCMNDAMAVHCFDPAMWADKNRTFGFIYFGY